MIVGTCSTLPGLGFTTGTDIDIAVPRDDGDFTPYMMYDASVNSWFDGGPTSPAMNCWRWTSCIGGARYLFGSELNASEGGGDPNDSYVVIEISEQTYVSGYKSIHVGADDIAILIY